MIRAVAVVLVALMCLWGGVPALTLAATNWQAVELPCADYDPTAIDGRWFELTGCVADFREAAYATVGQTVTEVYVPLRGDGQSSEDKAVIVLASRRAQHIALGEALIAARGDDAALERAWQTHTEVARLRGDVHGVTRPGQQVGAAEARTLNGLRERLHPHFVVLDDGATPDIRLGLGLTLAGVLLLILAAQGLRARKPGSSGA